MSPDIATRQTALIQALAAAGGAVLEHGGSVLLVAMKRAARAWDPGQDDDRLCHDLAARLGGEGPRVRVLAANDPAATAAALGRMDAVLTLRMHAAILAAARGVPAASIGITGKFTAFHERLGTADLLLAAQDSSPERVGAALERALAMTPEARAVLSTRAAELAAESARTAERLAAWVRQRLPHILVKDPNS